MKIFVALWIFYKKLILPSLSLSILLAFFGSLKLITGTGVAFVFLTPVFQFLFYDLARPNEYYFYYNMGLGKIVLWINTILMSLIIGLILALI